MIDSLIYPGEYTPLTGEKSLLLELALAKEVGEERIHPKINMDEFESYYKLEVRMPGVRRSEIVAHVDNNILSVGAIRIEDIDEKAKSLKIKEFDAPCFLRHIFLPENADTAFISAEFKKGILRFHIPKGTELSFLNARQVVVY